MVCYLRAVTAFLIGCTETIDQRLLVFFLRVAFLVFLFLLAARILSTRLGRLRPAFLAERLAAAFLAGDSFFDFLPAALRGLAFFQGGLRAIMFSYDVTILATPVVSGPCETNSLGPEEYHPKGAEDQHGETDTDRKDDKNAWSSFGLARFGGGLNYPIIFELRHIPLTSMTWWQVVGNMLVPVRPNLEGRRHGGCLIHRSFLQAAS